MIKKNKTEIYGHPFTDDKIYGDEVKPLSGLMEFKQAGDGVNKE